MLHWTPEGGDSRAAVITHVPAVCALSLPVPFLRAIPGLLNPLDSPHHMRMDEDSEYREGVVLDRPSKPGRGSFVNCGMRKVSLWVKTTHPVAGRTEAGVVGTSTAQLLSILLPSRLAWGLVLVLSCPVPSGQLTFVTSRVLACPPSMSLLCLCC